jgi:hypothetical protein
MASYQVQVVFNLGEVSQYIFPLVQAIGDPQEGMKATVIEGTRGDGAIVIPGGKKSQELRIKGILLDNDGYVDLTTLMDGLRSAINTDVAVITIRHWIGATWQIDRTWNVRRISEIEFQEDNMRTDSIEYTVRFLVISY